MANKLVAEIPKCNIEDDIEYLVIESDENDTKGYFLFFHKPQATFNYGINPDDWLISEL